MDLVAGTRVDRYEVLSLLGSGGLATVYRVRHVELDAQRALKVLHVSGGSRLERLRREGRLQAILHHPGIVQVMDVVPLPGGIGLVMELVEGCTLREWLATQGPGLDERLRIFRAVTEAVGHAHEHRIVHRDLKPENVLMSRVGGTWLPKVTDFGLARALADDGPSATRSGVGMGTPRYMAPEQIRDASRVDEQADVFALGCLLYLLACGREAFEGDSPASIWANILRGSITDPDAVASGLPAALTATIRACLRAPPAERPPGCGGVLAMLGGAAPPPVARAVDSTFDEGWLDPTEHAAHEAAEGAGARVAPSTLATPGPTLAPLHTEPDPPPAPEAQAPAAVPRGPASWRRRKGRLAAGSLSLLAGLALWAWAPPPSTTLDVAPPSPGRAGGDPRPPAVVAAEAPAVVATEAPASVPAPEAPDDQVPPLRTRAAVPRPNLAQDPSHAGGPSADEPEEALADVAPLVDVVAAEAETPPESLPPIAASDPTGRVEVAGPGEVMLRATATGRTYAPGAIPPGRYEIQVRFGDRHGSGFAFDLASGQTVTVSCNEATEVCRKL